MTNRQITYGALRCIAAVFICILLLASCAELKVAVGYWDWVYNITIPILTIGSIFAAVFECVSFGEKLSGYR